MDFRAAGNDRHPIRFTYARRKKGNDSNGSTKSTELVKEGVKV